MKLSFCTNCKSRVHHLEQTFWANLEACKGFNVEFIILNLNSQDSLDAWARQYLKAFIQDGTVIYLYETENEIYHSNYARNLAHRAATGDVLINLDADNFVGETCKAIIETFEQEPNSIVNFPSLDYLPDTWGRVCISRDNFYRLGGYDEQFTAYGADDRDLIFRAKAFGLKHKRFDNYPGSYAIRHDDEERYRLMGVPRWEIPELGKRNHERTEESIKAGRLVANLTGWGAAKVRINFEDVISWKPIYP
jgi:predicted glycosyltransferase involved in capsule biosynthesis